MTYICASWFRSFQVSGSCCDRPLPRSVGPVVIGLYPGLGIFREYDSGLSLLLLFLGFKPLLSMGHHHCMCEWTHTLRGGLVYAQRWAHNRGGLIYA